MNLIAKYSLKFNKELRIYTDDNPESPRDWGDSEIFLVYNHRNFYVEVEGYKPIDIYNYLYNNFENYKLNNYYIFTVYAYIHSGISLSLSHQGDKFDVSSTGFILVDKNDFDFDLQRKHNDELKNLSDEKIAEYYANNLITNWNNYLSGNVYRFELVNFKKYKKLYLFKNKEELSKDIFIEEEVIDSCGGFYSNDLQELLSYIDNKYITKKLKQIKTFN